MPESPTLKTQTINGRYEIKDSPIGQGGMGVVYKAYDIVTKRFVALKTMWGTVDASALELFEREWTVLARMSHPNIVDILDTGHFTDRGENQPYFVMPLLRGSTLDTLIRSSSERLSVEGIVEIMCQACRGLQAAHDEGLIHRDLKPSNIFVMEDDTVKIIDFGVVHLADTRSLTGLKGTLQYMAPEQLEMKPATPRSDIFSLAVVCYEALTGRKPFSRKTEGDVADAIRTYVPPPASDVNASVNALVSRTVHKGMAKDPWHRFSTAREFSDTLQKALRNEPIERFDRTKIQPRIDRIRRAQGEGDYQFAREILTELESEGHIDPEMSLLRIQIDQSIRQKTIRQLLDSARTRMEEDEYPLALQKIQEVLAIDPANVDAAALRSQIERHRSAKQIDGWARLARQHLENLLYRQAREAIQEILKVNAADAQGRELLAEVDRAESEAARVRDEKQKLYDAALTSYKNGEISTALSKLERLLNLTRATAKSSPDGDAQYQGLYNQIRSERDAARNAYAEGRKNVMDRNYTRALEICEEFLGRHPGDPMFQSLKIEAEEMQRQEYSAAIAEINGRIEAETDLDKKFNIVKDAVEKYPNEAHFKTSQKLIRERRDLINSIVTRARYYEERGQFNDAAGQWDILKNIYPSFPGLEFEVERLSRRREEQLRDEGKSRWAEKVDQLLGAGDYARAREVLREALVEFPGDSEFSKLDTLAEQATKRRAEANVLLKEGQALCADRKYEDGLNALRKAERLDERNPSVHNALLGNLIEHARGLMSQNWRAAEPLVQEALALECSDPVARSLASLVEDYKRQEAVGKFVLEARNLQAANDLPAAIKKAEEGLGTYPNEIRLSQLRNTLRAAQPEGRSREAVPPPPAPVQEQAAAAPTVLFAAAPAAKSVPAPPPAVPAAVETIIQPSSARAADVPKTPVPPAKPVAAPKVTPPVKPPPPVKAAAVPVPGSTSASQKKKVPLVWGAVAAAVVLIGAGLVVTKNRQHSSSTPVQAKPITPPVKTVAVTPAAPVLPELRINTDLKAGHLVLDSNPPFDLPDGNTVNSGIAAGDHSVKILDGAKEVFSFAFRVEPNSMIAVTTPPAAKNVPGVVISAFSDSARLYSTAGIKAGLGGAAMQAVSSDGLPFTGIKLADGKVVIDDGKGKPRNVQVEAASQPLLTVILLGNHDKIPVTLSANVPDGNVVVNGVMLKRGLINGTRTVSLAPGKYTIKITRADYQDSPEQIVEVKATDANVAPPVFTLTAIIKNATLAIVSAPPDTEVLVDNERIGTTNSAGSLTKDIAPGSHSISLRKANFEPFTVSKDLKAGESASISGAGMKAFGSLVLKVTPASAHIIYQREVDGQSSEAANNETASVRAGTYTVTAQADGYKTKSETVQVSSGKPSPVDWKLDPAKAETKVAEITPAVVFDNGASWNVDASSWWNHEGKGLSFLKGSPSNVVVDFLKQQQRKIFKNSTKKIAFVVDYKDDNEKILYSLDDHNIHRRVFGAQASPEEKQAHGMDGDGVYQITISVSADGVTIKNKAGKVIDTVKHTGSGKIGFLDDLGLKVMAVH